MVLLQSSGENTKQAGIDGWTDGRLTHLHTVFVIRKKKWLAVATEGTQHTVEARTCSGL